MRGKRKYTSAAPPVMMMVMDETRGEKGKSTNPRLRVAELCRSHWAHTEWECRLLGAGT